MKLSFHSKSHIDLISKTRIYLNSKLQSPLFNTSVVDQYTLPKLRRLPTTDELRNARNIILDMPEDLLYEHQDLLQTPNFYFLNEFMDLIFHPELIGLDLATIGTCLKEVGLKLLTFEYPNITHNKVLIYQAENPQDPKLRDLEKLDKFNKEYPMFAYKNFTGTSLFVEKPVN